MAIHTFTGPTDRTINALDTAAVIANINHRLEFLEADEPLGSTCQHAFAISVCGCTWWVKHIQFNTETRAKEIELRMIDDEDRRVEVSIPTTKAFLLSMLKDLSNRVGF
jgi:hypothetical protein